MHLVFGGAYQGKLEYVKEIYGVEDKDVYTCKNDVDRFLDYSEPQIDFSRKVIDGLEQFVQNCALLNIEAKDYLDSNKEAWQDKVIIAQDISSGIVPFEEELRAWREMMGRTLVYLGKEAEEVTRVFCGIPQKIK